MSDRSISALVDSAIPEGGSALIAPGPIAKLLGVSCTTIATMSADGRLPPGIKINSNNTRYPRALVRLALLRLLGDADRRADLWLKRLIAEGESSSSQGQRAQTPAPPPRRRRAS